MSRFAHVLLFKEGPERAGYGQIGVVEIWLAGESIPPLARILAVADAYDSMSTTSAYREALACEEVESELRAGAGSRWDPKVVGALVRARQAVHAIRQCGVGESLRVAMEAALRHGGALTPSSTFTPPETDAPM